MDEEQDQINNEDIGSRLLRTVQRMVISPEDAQQMVDGYLNQSREKYSNGAHFEHQSRVADKIIQRYSKQTALVGGATGLTGVVPGIGTLVAAFGGGTTDTAICMKLQVDMCMCLAYLFGYDITSEDGRHLAFLIAATGSAQKAGVKVGFDVGSKAGVRMLRQYLKGAALQAIKQMFRRVGVTFTRKALEKAIPFGVGVLIGSGANYALTRFVGSQAKKWFIIDEQDPTPEP